jgi:dethiobiotin synthetase
MHPIPDLFVVGTDTGVGKSLVALLLMQLLFIKGYCPFYFKPFQTGCADPYDTRCDAKFIYDHTTALAHQDPAQSVVYCFPDPKAPFFAAEGAGDKIDLSVVRQVLAEMRKKHAPVVVEGAGGVLVPITRQVLLVDTIMDLGCRPLLVARAGLGTINHTLLSIEALRRRQLEPLGVIFVDAATVPANPDLVNENIEAVRTYGNVKIGGLIRAISDFSNPPVSAYAVFDNILA